MNREEAKKILGEGATDEQVTNLLNQFHSNEKSKNDEIQKLKDELSKFSDYNDMKKKLDDIEKANMSEQEKLAQMQKDAEANLKQSKIIVNKAKATEILAGLNLSEDIINSLVREDEAQTITNANNLAASLKTMQEETIKKTKEELAAIDVKPNLSNVNQGNDAMTWEKFSGLSQEEQNKFVAENPDEFAKL